MPAVLVGGRRFEWAGGAKVSIGRDPAGDVVVDGPRVSRLHVLVEAVDGGWVVRDAGSRNGTFHAGAPVSEIKLDGPLELSLGSATDGSRLQLALEAAPAEEPTRRPPDDPVATVHPDGGTRPGTAARVEEPKSELGRFQVAHRPSAARFRIGRAPDNDLALENDPRASRYHAELRRLDGGGVELVDLNSHNGTFVNGHRIAHAPMNEGDTVAIGNHVFRFLRGALEEFAQADGANLDVAAVSVVIDGATLLDSVSFSVESRSMLAVVGPSGAGKTTLLRALTGFARPTHGAVRFGGRDLYTDYDELRARLGYVPQEDLVHEQLTVRQELEFAGALRLPPDLGHAGFAKRADEVMAELGLTARAELPIEKLSGGQRKRVSVGVELLTQPALLYLDEPTSGLDPGNERQVMQVLRVLADGGRIVVVVTHSTQSIDVADRVLFLATGGHMAYYGPPREALKYFERQGVAGGWPAVFQALEGAGGAAWGERFRRDADFGRYVGALGDAASVPRPVPPPVQSRTKLAGPVDPRRQTVILCRRQLRLIAGDRKSVILLAAQAPVFGLILTLLFPAHTIATNRGPFAAMLLWLLIVSATWLGASNTVREIVKEQSIYRRERAAGLSMLSYTSSKVIVFGVITMVQSLVVLIIVLIAQPLPPGDPLKVVPILGQNGILNGLRPFAVGSVISSQVVEVFIAMALAGLAGMAIGLLVSSAVRKSDQAVFMLPVILIVEMALSQPILQLSNPSPVLKFLGDLTSANWGVNAVASTTSLNQLMTSYSVALSGGTDQLKYELAGIGTPPALLNSQKRAALFGDPAWAHKSGTWILAIVILILMVAFFLVCVLLLMRRLDTGNRHSLLEDVQGFVGSSARQRPARLPAGRPGPPPGAGWGPGGPAPGPYGQGPPVAPGYQPRPPGPPRPPGAPPVSPAPPVRQPYPPAPPPQRGPVGRPGQPPAR
jgi:ABC-type multidrug transport system ATPase subunit